MQLSKEMIVKTFTVLILYIVMVLAVIILINQNPSYTNPITVFNELVYSNNSLLLVSAQIALVAPVLIIVGIILLNKNQHKFSKVYGDSHFANLAEVKKYNFLEKSGLVVGYHKNKLLRVPIKSHVLVFAPSRSGKGVSQVIPNALNWNGSMLVTDIKMEVFKYTSGFRQKHGSDVYLFAPSSNDARTNCFNPLDLIDRYDQAKRVTQLQQVINIILPDVSNDNPMWVNEARSLALGLLLYLADSDKPFTLGELKDLIKGTPNLEDYLQTILDESVVATNLVDIDPICYQNINNYLAKADKEQSGVRSELISHLSLWDDPYVRAATDRSDFDIRDMRKKPITIYLGIPEKDLSRLKPLVNLFIQLFVNTLTHDLPTNDEPYKVLCILDEFCNLGKMDIIKKGISFLAGYNVHLMAIIQNLAQGYEVYGKDGFDAFISNTDYKICYYQNDLVGCEFVSKLLGTRTVKARSVGYRQFGRGNSNYNESYIARPLLTPDEVAKFPKDEAISLVSGGYPIRYNRIIYYTDPRFKDRVLPSVQVDKITPVFSKVNVVVANNKKFTENDIAAIADSLD